MAEYRIRPRGHRTFAPSPEAATAGKRIADAISVIRAIDPNMPIQVAHFFLHAATHAGLGVMDIGRAIGMSRTSCQRAFQALSDGIHWRKGDVPLGLLSATTDMADARRSLVDLTPKGRRLLEQIGEAVAAKAEGQS